LRDKWCLCKINLFCQWWTFATIKLGWVCYIIVILFSSTNKTYLKIEIYNKINCLSFLRTQYVVILQKLNYSMAFSFSEMTFLLWLLHKSCNGQFPWSSFNFKDLCDYVNDILKMVIFRCKWNYVRYNDTTLIMLI